MPHPNRPFKLLAYDPTWPKQFKTKAAILFKLLGSEALSIEHIGSTAIPGMIAKPQIDILIIVKDLNRIKDYYDQMQQAGFTPRGDYTGECEEYFTEDAKGGSRLTSIHVLPKGHAWAKDLIDFRDYLRTHPEATYQYLESKRLAAEKYQDNYDAYHKTKRKTITVLRQKAVKWKQSESKKELGL